jgi:hypothetical protein
MSRSAFGVEHISKADTAPPSQDELRRRKKRSAHLTIASSTLGVAGLAAMGAGKLVPMAAKAANTSGKAAKYVPKKIKGMSQKKADKFGNKAINTAWGLSTGATGVGGISGYNYAALQRAEARKKRI